MVAAYRTAGFEVTDETILSYAKVETASQSEVAQRTLTVAEIAPYSPIHFKTMGDAYCELSEKFRQSEEALAVKSAALSKRKEQLRRFERSGAGKWATLWRRLKPGCGRAVRAS